MRPEHKELVTALLSCLSVGCFLHITHLLFPVTGPVVLGFLALYVTISVLFAANSGYHERTRERFDLTAPTLFENGLLVLRSRKEKCAAFFAFALRPKAVQTERIRRTFITLLKILPHASVLSVEMTKHHECFANFYIKLERSDVLQRTRELVESALSALTTLFGKNDVQALRNDELFQHLALGVPGRVQQVGRSSRYAALLRTDKARCWLSAITTTQIPVELAQKTGTESNQNSGIHRVMFAVKSEEQRRVVIGPKVVVTTSSDRQHSVGPVVAWSPTIRRIPASEITRKLGDIMTRNVFTNDGIRASFEKGADELFSFLSLWSTRRPGTESGGTETEIRHQETANPREWRRLLAAATKALELTLETDTLVWTNGFPLRVDARVGSILFKIIPKGDGNRARIQWWMEQLATALASEPASSLALLFSSPSDASTVAEVLMRMPAHERVQSLTSVVQLQELLLQLKATRETATIRRAKAVQKIL